MPTPRRISLVLAFAATAGCAGDSGPRAAVVFALDAPLCSTTLPVRFWVDSMVIGTDTFRVNLAPDHTTSVAFPIPAGTRRIGANVDGGYVWPDTVVDLADGAVFTRILPFYCS